MLKKLKSMSQERQIKEKLLELKKKIILKEYKVNEIKKKIVHYKY